MGNIKINGSVKRAFLADSSKMKLKIFLLANHNLASKSCILPHSGLYIALKRGRRTSGTHVITTVSNLNILI